MVKEDKGKGAIAYLTNSQPLDVTDAFLFGIYFMNIFITFSEIHHYGSQMKEIFSVRPGIISPQCLSFQLNCTVSPEDSPGLSAFQLFLAVSFLWTHTAPAPELWHSWISVEHSLWSSRHKLLFNYHVNFRPYLAFNYTL